MLNLIQRLRQAFVAPTRDSGADPCDAFAHPALARMSPRELADLPFPRPRPTSASQPARAPTRAAA